MTEHPPDDTPVETGRRDDEFEITREMIAQISELEMHTMDDPDWRLRSAASVFAAIFFAMPDGLRGPIKSVVSGGYVWRWGVTRTEKQFRRYHANREDESLSWVGKLRS